MNQLNFLHDQMILTVQNKHRNLMHSNLYVLSKEMMVLFQQLEELMLMKQPSLVNVD